MSFVSRDGRKGLLDRGAGRVAGVPHRVVSAGSLARPSKGQNRVPYPIRLIGAVTLPGVSKYNVRYAHGWVWVHDKGRSALI